MKRRVPAAWLTLILLLSGPASSQVYKCPDPANNRTVYSDKPCTGDGAQLARKRSPDEIEYDRQKAAAEYQKFQASQQREAAREQAAQRPTYQQPNQANTTANTRSPECARAQRDLEFATSSVTGSDDQKAASIAAASRKVDLACLGASKAGAIRAAEAGAPKVEITNHNYGGATNPSMRECKPSASGMSVDCW
jgi:hypothetical protein